MLLKPKYKVKGENGSHHGTFTKLEDAKEHAQETSDCLNIDVYIEKVETELISWFFPETEGDIE